MNNTIGLSDVSNMERQRNVEESGLSRHIWDVEHAGSNPAIPTDMVRTRQCVKIGSANW